MLILHTAIVRSFCGPIKYDQSDYLEALDLLANCDSGGLVGLQGEPVQMSINHRKLPFTDWHRKSALGRK